MAQGWMKPNGLLRPRAGGEEGPSAPQSHGAFCSWLLGREQSCRER